MSRLAKLVGRGLEIILEKEYLADAIVSQRALAIHLDGLLIFLQRVAQLADRHELLAAFDGHFHAHVRAPAQHAAARIDGHGFRLAERVD